MHFCISCKKQFNEGMTRMGECPYCGQVSMTAKQRIDLKRFTLRDNSDRIKEIENLLRMKYGTKILHEHD